MALSDQTQFLVSALVFMANHRGLAVDLAKGTLQKAGEVFAEKTLGGVLDVALAKLGLTTKEPDALPEAVESVAASDPRKVQEVFDLLRQVTELQPFLPPTYQENHRRTQNVNGDHNVAIQAGDNATFNLNSPG